MFNLLLLTILATVRAATPAITDWENELPLLIYHGLDENCTAYHTIDVMYAWN